MGGCDLKAKGSITMKMEEVVDYVKSFKGRKQLFVSSDIREVKQVRDIRAARQMVEDRDVVRVSVDDIDNKHKEWSFHIMFREA